MVCGVGECELQYYQPQNTVVSNALKIIAKNELIAYWILGIIHFIILLQELKQILSLILDMEGTSKNKDC